jgi:hypothetical protein
MLLAGTTMRNRRKLRGKSMNTQAGKTQENTVLNDHRKPIHFQKKILSHKIGDRIFKIDLNK